MKFVFSFLIVLVLLPVYSQDSETHTLSGYVTDSKSGEALIGAKVFIPEINKGAITNTYGFYSLTVNAGVYLVEFRSALYPSEIREVSFNEDVNLDIEIGSNTQDLEEVVVNGKKGDNVKSTQMGEIKLDIESIKALPAFMGEVDVVKTIQLLPGVSSVAEGQVPASNRIFVGRHSFKTLKNTQCSLQHLFANSYDAGHTSVYRNALPCHVLARVGG